MALYSIIIPARNEAALIAGTLRFLLADADIGAGASDARIIVVCNGCTDTTADCAREVSGPIKVVELATAGKVKAINYGLEHVQPGPVFVMDADIHMRLSGFDRMAEALMKGDADAVSPSPYFLCDASAPVVRRYFRVYERHPYLTRGVGGSGVWGVSTEGRAALGTLPDIMADDNYVRARFPSHRQARITLGREIGPLIQAPRTRADLLRCEARWRSGDAQLARLRDDIVNRNDALFRPGDLMVAMRRNWSDPLGLLSYFGIKILGRGTRLGNQARQRDHIWHRDETSRVAVPSASVATR